MIRETSLVAFVAVLVTLGVVSCERQVPAEQADTAKQALQHAKP